MSTEVMSLISSSRAISILSLDDVRNVSSLVEMTKKHGVLPVGVDGQKNLHWRESDIQGLVDKIKANTKKSQKEKEDDEGFVQRRIALVGIQIAGLLSDVEVLKKQGQEIIRRMSEPSIATLPKGSQEAVISELSGFIASYMADQQRLLTGQVDSALNSIDKKMDHIEKMISGQGRSIGETRAKVDDVMRISNSTVSNFFSTQQATRSEIIKSIDHLRSSIGDLSEFINNLAEKK